MAAHRQHPETVGSELNGSAIDHDGVVAGDAEASQPLGHLLRRRELAVGLVPEDFFPLAPDGAGQMTCLVGGTVGIHLKNADLGIIEMVCKPGGGDQRGRLLRCLRAEHDDLLRAWATPFMIGRSTISDHTTSCAYICPLPLYNLITRCLNQMLVFD